MKRFANFIIMAALSGGCVLLAQIAPSHGRRRVAGLGATVAALQRRSLLLIGLWLGPVIVRIHGTGAAARSAAQCRPARIGTRIELAPAMQHG